VPEPDPVREAPSAARTAGQHHLLAGAVDPEPVPVGRHQGRRIRLDDDRAAGALRRDGELVPWLVEEIPTVENGGVSEDLTSITWKITPGHPVVGRHAVHLGRRGLHL
jgi:hypothetical protein